MRDLPLPTLPLFDLRLNSHPSRSIARQQTTQPAAEYRPTPPQAAPVAFEAVWARHLDEVRLAQQLRHRVFVEEMGASVSVPAGTPAGTRRGPLRPPLRTPAAARHPCRR